MRTSGCGKRPGVAESLRRVPALDQAAARVANGDRLEPAMSQSGYRASRATVIHIEARSGSSAVTKFLAGRYCELVTDRELAELGTTTHGDEVWILLAAPQTPARMADAKAMGARVLELVNRARAEPRRCGRRKFAAAGPLRPSAALEQAARTHAQDMAARDDMTHAGGDGSSVGGRVTRSGYAWRVVAENVAEGQDSADAVVAEWLASPGHCANLMDPRYSEMGVAYAINPGSRAEIYWAQVFATPQTAAP